MKTMCNIINMLSGKAVPALLLTLLLGMSSCGKGGGQPGDPGVPPTPGTDPVPITLRAGIYSRAPIGPGGDTGFTPTIAGWEAAAAATPFGGSPLWITTSLQPVAHDAAGQVVELASERYYNADRTVYTHIKAWYPQGTTITSGVVDFDSPAVDGSQDVLIAPAVKGAKFDEIATPLRFVHPLTQVRVKMVREPNSAPIDLYSLTVKSVQLPVGLDLRDDQLVYSAAADLSIFSGTHAVTNAGSTVGSPVMFRPLPGKLIYFDVESSAGTYHSVEAAIDGDDNFVAGKAYTITLTFAPSGEITGIGAITDWTDGEVGEGIVE